MPQQEQRGRAQHRQHVPVDRRERKREQCAAHRREPAATSRRGLHHAQKLHRG